LTIIHLPVNSVFRNSVDRNFDLSNFCASSMITVPYIECAYLPVAAGILTIFTAYMKFNQRWPLMLNPYFIRLRLPGGNDVADN
jgi:hypothetical protein